MAIEIVNSDPSFNGHKTAYIDGPLGIVTVVADREFDIIQMILPDGDFDQFDTVIEFHVELDLNGYEVLPLNFKG